MKWFKLGANDAVRIDTSELERGLMDALRCPMTLIEAERIASENKLDDLRGQELSLEDAIAAWQSELRQVRKVREIEERRLDELKADDTLLAIEQASADVSEAIAPKRKRASKPAPILQAAE